MITIICLLIGGVIGFVVAALMHAAGVEED